MNFRTHILRVDPHAVESVQYFLMLMQVPDDGRMGNRSVVEGVHMGYSSADSLKKSFVRAKVRDEFVDQLNSALRLNSPLAFVGVLDLDLNQVRELGFQTLAKMIAVPALDR